MDRARSFTLVWVPRRHHLVVSSANHRSTRFIHDDDVGVKWNWKRGWRTSQRWIAGVLWVEELSNTTWTVSPAGTLLIDQLQELLELDGSVAGGELVDHGPAGQV